MTVSQSGPADSPRDLILPGAGIRLHGLDWGGPADGQLVLLLHGVGGNAWIWNAVAPRLRQSLPGHRIVAIDQRDGGDTEHPPMGYRREDFAADALAAQRALSDRPMVLVGHSRGAWLASGIAGEHRERVERLVLIDPARLVYASGGDADRFYAWVYGSLGPFASDRAALRWSRMTDRLARHTRSASVPFSSAFDGPATVSSLGSCRARWCRN
ncbi:MAG TPA: alpha/beta hydrolase [Candidatus Limnocylindrales bacterium]|nr:alpha/beta hydrolase [Candidatus Limnocylindrales bacterium]